MQSALTTLVHGTYEQPFTEALPGQRVATFLFVLGGRQRMRFDAGDRGASLTVEADPGDLLYWPSPLSPVAEPYAGWASTGVRVSVVREGRQAAAELYDLLHDVTPETLLTPDPDPAGAGPPGEESLLVPDAEAGSELPVPLERALAHFRSAGARGPLEERVARQSLRHWTAGGFRPVPPCGAARQVRRRRRRARHGARAVDRGRRAAAVFRVRPCGGHGTACRRPGRRTAGPQLRTTAARP